jgi:N-acetylated-alpha-linked acidic dipeptidase
MPTKFKTFLIGLLLSTSIIAQHNTISGFTPGNTGIQQELELSFDKNLKASNIGNTIKELSAFPHELGSAGSKR